VIGVVTDSTCDLPKALIDRYGIRVVPAYINVDGKSLRDEVDLSRTQFYSNLMTYPEHPTTAAGPPAQFAAVYQELTEGGATEIISIHVSAKLSGIINSAQAGAKMGDFSPVTVIDSLQLSMGIGFQVLAAARAARNDASMEEIIQILDQFRPRIRTIAMLDTLDAVQRSGRVSWLQMQVGNLLRLKQIVEVREGDVLPVARVRTRKSALLKFEEIVAELGDIKQFAFMNTNNSIEVMAQFEVLFGEIIENTEIFRTVASPAIGVHIGLKAIGVAFVLGKD